MWNRLVGWLPAPGFGDSDAESSAGLQSDTRLKVKVTQSCPTLCDPMNSPGQNPGVGSLSLPQGIFPTQGWNPGLPHGRRILYQLSHQRSPRILEWVAIPSPADLPDPGIEPGSPALQADSLPTELSGEPETQGRSTPLMSVPVPGF